MPSSLSFFSCTWRLYSRLGEGEQAAVLYERYLQETEDADRCEDRGQVYQFLSSHYLQKNMLDLAYDYAQKCTLFMEVRVILGAFDFSGWRDGGYRVRDKVLVGVLLDCLLN